jgi:hypothetical protein
MGGAARSRRRQAEALIAALNARDFDSGVWRELDPEFEFHSALSAAEGEYHVGMDGMRSWAGSMDEMWEDFRIELTESRELDDGRG